MTRRRYLNMSMCLLLAILPTLAQAQQESMDAVMKANFVVSRVKDSITNSTFILTNATGQSRERKTLGYSKLLPNGNDNMRLTRFLAPADVKGTGILLIEHAERDDDIWIWLPALKKVRRLLSSNKKDSFLGTDFSYGDIIGHRVEDWTHRLLKEETVDGAPCYVVESVPKASKVKTDSGYSKRTDWIRKDNYIAVRGEFWDESGQPLKQLKASDIKLIDAAANKWQAMLVEARNYQTGHSTRIRIDNIRVNQNLRDEQFTTRVLERE